MHLKQKQVCVSFDSMGTNWDNSTISLIKNNYITGIIVLVQI